MVQSGIRSFVRTLAAMLYIPLARNRVNQSSFSAAQIRPGRNAAGVGGLSFVHCILAGWPGETRHSVFLNIKSVKP